MTPTRPSDPARLRELAANRQMADDTPIKMLTIGELRAALAAERHNTVERIRERLETLSSSDLEHWADHILHSSDGSGRAAFAAYVLKGELDS